MDRHDVSLYEGAKWVLGTPKVNNAFKYESVILPIGIFVIGFTIDEDTPDTYSLSEKMLEFS